MHMNAGGCWINEVGLRALAIHHNRAIAVLDVTSPLEMRVYPPTVGRAYLINPMREAQQRRRAAPHATVYCAHGSGGCPAAPDLAFHRDTIVLMKDSTHFWCTRPADGHNTEQLMEAYHQQGGSVWKYEQQL